MIRKWLARRALERTMRPDPAYRDNRLSQFSPERRARYWDNVAKVFYPGDGGQGS